MNSLPAASAGCGHPATHPMLACQPRITELATQCLDAAGPDHGADLALVEAAIVNMSCTQVRNWFTALHRKVDAENFSRLPARPDFSEHMLWDHLTGDPQKIKIRNQLAELLNSDLVRQIVVGAIRQRFRTLERSGSDSPIRRNGSSRQCFTETLPTAPVSIGSFTVSSPLPTARWQLCAPRLGDPHTSPPGRSSPPATRGLR